MSAALKPHARGQSFDLDANTVAEVHRLAYLLNVHVYVSQRTEWEDSEPEWLRTEAMGNWPTVAYEYEPGTVLNASELVHLPTASGATPSTPSYNRMLWMTGSG